MSTEWFGLHKKIVNDTKASEYPIFPSKFSNTTQYENPLTFMSWNTNGIRARDRDGSLLKIFEGSCYKRPE